MKPRVLVTRAEPGASETARRLAAMGFEPIVEPLFSVEPIAAHIPIYDALAFTSANGVREFAKRTRRRDASVFCVGARTAEAARDTGFGTVASADGDVGALARLIESKLEPGAHLLHAGNEESRGDLTGRLVAKGFSAAFLAIYRAAPVSRPGPGLARHFSGMPAFEAILIHSPRGADILESLATKSPGRAPLDVAAMSPAAAAPLSGLARRIETAAHPNETALLAALKRLCDSG